MNDYETKIKNYLDKRAAEDPLFAKSYAKEKKSIEECCLYILGEALKKAYSYQGGKAAVMDDEVVYGMAVHYYDEDDIKVKPLNPQVSAKVSTSTSSKAEPTKKDLENAKKEAMERIIEEERKKMLAPRKKQRQVAELPTQLSLFE